MQRGSGFVAMRKKGFTSSTSISTQRISSSNGVSFLSGNCWQPLASAEEELEGESIDANNAGIPTTIARYHAVHVHPAVMSIIVVAQRDLVGEDVVALSNATPNGTHLRLDEACHNFRLRFVSHGRSRSSTPCPSAKTGGPPAKRSDR